MQIKEQWRVIENFDNAYYVSNTGRVWSMKIKTSSGGVILKPAISKGGYCYVYLYKNGNAKMFNVHRLVATHFINNDDNKKCINHKDGNKLNNSVTNLEWCTHSENTKHAYNNNLNTRQIGELNGKSKLLELDVALIRELYGDNEFTQKELAEIFKVKQPAISKIILNLTWVVN
jgi:hypothetical protein